MRSLFISPHFSQLSLKLKYLITNYTNGNTDSTKTIRANLEQIFIEIGTAACTRSRCCFSLYHLFFYLIQYYPQSIHTSFSKIQKVSKFAQFSFKTTHISGCKNVHIYTFATLTMQLCMVTVALYNNNLFFFFFFSLTIQVPSLSQWPQQLSKEEEDKYPTTNSAQPNHYHRNPFQRFIIHHNIDPKSTSKQTKPSENPTQNQAKPTKEPT